MEYIGDLCIIFTYNKSRRAIHPSTLCYSSVYMYETD